MSLASDVRTALLAMDEVTALVGTGSAARIRPYKMNKRDDLSKQHVLIEVDTETRENSIDGRGGLVYAEVVVNCRALGHEEARALAEAVRVNGTNPGTGLAGLAAANFDSWLDSETPGQTRFDDNSEQSWDDVAQLYTMVYSETP